MTMRQALTRGAVWSLIEKGGQQGLSFVVFLVLARLLGPEEYGLANICFIYLALTNMILMGLVDGVVSLQVDDQTRLSSLFWGIMGLGFSMSALCAGSAPMLAAFMREPVLTNLLWSFSVVPILIAGSAVPNLLVLKEMNFRIYAARTLIATLFAGAFGIVLAYEGYGAYALVGQQIAFSLMVNAIIWSGVTWRPQLAFSATIMGQILRPGLAVTGVNVLGFLDGQMPRLLIGRMLGPLPLGTFALATRLRFSLTEILVTSPMTVLYPGLAKLQDDKERQCRLARKVSVLSAYAIFPLLALFASTAPQYVPLVFGEKWTSAVPILQIYIVGAAASPLVVIVQQVFRANSSMHLCIPIASALVGVNLLMTLLLFHENGLVLMSAGIALNSFAGVPALIIVLQRRLDINLWGALFSLWVPALGAVLTYAAVSAYLDSSQLPKTPWIGLMATCALGIGVYGMWCAAFGLGRIRNGGFGALFDPFPLRAKPRNT